MRSRVSKNIFLQSSFASWHCCWHSRILASYSARSPTECPKKYVKCVEMSLHTCKVAHTANENLFILKGVLATAQHFSKQRLLSCHRNHKILWANSGAALSYSVDVLRLPSRHVLKLNCSLQSTWLCSILIPSPACMTTSIPFKTHILVKNAGLMKSKPLKTNI